MKGQTQAVTAVMITGIMIGTIAAVYVWGTPLLEKRESQAQLNQVQGDVISLRNSIESTSNSGEGSASEVTIRVSQGSVNVNESGNYIDVTTYTEGSSYPLEAWRIIDGSNLQGLSIGSGDYGLQGEDSPGVVAARAQEGGSEDRVTFRIEFRNLLDSQDQEVELTNLQVAGSPESNGETVISLSNQGVESDSLEINTGEDFDREKTNLRVTLS
ncbi:MAG: hypothetical protein R6V35_05440 [Candidatus Nanohaloarchaea archaeon]